ncbi:MAG: GntR family transcriptional regulator [Hyphomicrobium sp.]
MSMTAASRFATRPLYLQVRDLLVQRITLREWPPGSALPNEFQLAEELRVSTGTVRKALELLEEERVISRRQGRGTFVSDHSSSEFAIRFTNIVDPQGAPVSGQVDFRGVERVVASEQAIARLGLRQGQDVWQIRRTHRSGGTPYMAETSVVPAGMYHRLAPVPGSCAINVLAQANNIILKDALERVGLANCPSEDAAELGIGAGTPVLMLDRVIYAIDNRPAEWRLAHCHLGPNSYVARIS